MQMVLGKCDSQLGDIRNVSSLTIIAFSWKLDQVYKQLLGDKSTRLAEIEVSDDLLECSCVNLVTLKSPPITQLLPMVV